MHRLGIIPGYCGGVLFYQWTTGALFGTESVPVILFFLAMLSELHTFDLGISISSSDGPCGSLVTANLMELMFPDNHPSTDFCQVAGWVKVQNCMLVRGLLFKVQLPVAKFFHADHQLKVNIAPQHICPAPTGLAVPINQVGLKILGPNSESNPRPKAPKSQGFSFWSPTLVCLPGNLPRRQPFPPNFKVPWTFQCEIQFHWAVICGSFHCYLPNHFIIMYDQRRREDEWAPE